MGWMRNHIPPFYVDEMIYECPNLDAGLAITVSKRDLCGPFY